MPAPFRAAHTAMLALLLAACALLVPAPPALAHHECNDVPNCVSVASGVIELDRSGSAHPTLRCPANAQYGQGDSWDKSSRAVSVTAVPTFMNQGFVFTAINWSPTHRNTVVLYIGCSPNQP